MLTDDLQQVANAVVRRAQRQGSVRPSDIRSELARTNFPQDQWERVLALSGSLLRYRRGRYYYEARKTSPLEAEEKQQKIIHQTVKQLIRQYKKSHAQMERRRQGRTDYVQPVKVRTEDDREIT